jgi:hypothetical protein
MSSPGTIVFIGEVAFGNQKFTSSTRPFTARVARKSNQARSVLAMNGSVFGYLIRCGGGR